jgi:hypothetical protein
VADTQPEFAVSAWNVAKRGIAVTGKLTPEKLLISRQPSAPAIGFMSANSLTRLKRLL